jgi:hypothetical protein
MTAIYAYVRQSVSRAALGADDIIIPWGTRTDKVQLTSDHRWAVAQSGPQLPLHALGVVDHFHGRPGYNAITSAEGLVEAILGPLRELRDSERFRFEREVKQRRLSAKEWKAHQRQPSNLVVLDCERFELFKVSFGCPFGPDGLETAPTIERQFDGFLTKFALAGREDGRPATTGLGDDDMADPRALFQRQLAEDRPRQPAIGKLGAFVTVVDTQVMHHTCYSDPVDMMRQLTGFTAGRPEPEPQGDRPAAPLSL